MNKNTSDYIRGKNEAIDLCLTLLKTHHMMRTAEDDFNPRIEIPEYKSLYNSMLKLKEEVDEN